MNLSIISLIVLVIVVAIGFIKKVNLGFYQLVLHSFWGTVGGMSAKEIAAGFSSSMFITLVGVTFLFGMASNNGTLELFFKENCCISRKTYGSDSDSDVLPFGFYFSNRTGTYCSRYFDDNICNVPCFEMDINPMDDSTLCKTGRKCRMCIRAFAYRCAGKKSFRATWIQWVWIAFVFIDIAFRIYFYTGCICDLQRL